MRIGNAVVISLVALASAITVSITGQEEPLPVVRAKGPSGDTSHSARNADSRSRWAAEPVIDLAADPIRQHTPTSIAEAARNNDYVTFQELYVRAQNRGEDVSRYQTLYELWSWAIADPIGAFYGREMYDQLARAYPDYARYIDEFRLVDRRGNAFFPTAETRLFLLDRARQGEVPRVMLAISENEPQTALPKIRAAAQPRVAAPAPGSQVVPAVGDQRRAAEAAAASQVAATAPVVAPPRREAPARVSTTGAQRQAAEAATVTQKAVAESETMAPPITIIATPDPVVITPPVVAHQPQQIARAQAEPAIGVPVAPEPSNEGRNRGILLLIIGLLGTGILAVILRAPKEEARPLVDLSEGVRPIRKPTTPRADEHPATGLRG